MKAFQTLSGWILYLVIAFLTLQVVAGGYTMEQTCEYIPNGFIADPTSCQGYGYCNNSQLVSKGYCPEGYIFNSEEHTCDFPSRFNCSVSDVNSICQFVADKSIVADPNDCRQFCQCVNKIAECNSCPQYQRYNSEKKKCEWSKDFTEPCMADSICRLVKSGTFAGDPDKCGSYIKCTKGTGTSAQCSGTTNIYFNAKTGYCEPENPCELQGNNAGVCQNAGGKQFVADGKTCYGYYYCKDNNGPGIWSKCPPGLHFNPNAGGTPKCVTPFTFRCTHDRCGNLNQTFVGAIDTDCHNYLYCVKEVASTAPNYTGFACKDNEYFDEVKEVCGPSKPTNHDYALCTTAGTKNGVQKM